MPHTTTKTLLIEDDPGDHLLLKRSLLNCRASFSLKWADRLASGLEALARESFDVVLTDLSLPDAQGLDTVRRIRECDTTTPIIVMTTIDDPDVEAKAMEYGAQDYLVKGEAVPHAIERIIRHAIQRQESLAQIERLLSEVQADEQLLAEQKAQLELKNKRLRKLYKTAHRFVDNVSHEFRTPLAVIKDYIALVREGMVGEVNDEQRRMLDVAAVRANDLNNMVDDMLDVSRFESGLLAVWRRPCRLSDIVGEVMSGLVQKAAVKQIEFEIDTAQDLPDVYCDSEKVGRVIINLVTNAMKFCGEPGHVRLWTKADPVREEVEVGITDNGPGIEAKLLESLFKRFKQIRQRKKSSTKGFGLGLNIAKELVALNFGEIRVESVVDEGSTFSFTIPMSSPRSVVRRYADRVAVGKSGARAVSVLVASIDRQVSESVAEDVDAFFNYMLRQNDLLFRRDTHRWAILLMADPTDVEGYVSRIKREFRKTNRNRPFGPLPQYDIQLDGTWDLPAHSESLFARFDALFVDEEAMCTT